MTRAKRRWASSTSCCSRSLTHFNSGPLIPMIRRCRRRYWPARHWQYLEDAEADAVGDRAACFRELGLAFQGNHLFQGNFYGVNIFDISNPANTTLLTSLVCPGGQGDVSVYKNLLFMSVEMPNGRWIAARRGFRRSLRHPQGLKKKKNAACRQRKRTVSAA